MVASGFTSRRTWGLVVAVYVGVYGVPQIVGETILKNHMIPSLFR